MKSRCSDQNKGAWADYGGRGIFVCDEWLKFIPFMEWANANGYADTLQLDRVDNDGPYSPENCRWVTRAENMANRRPSRPLGLRYTLKEVETGLRRAGIDPSTVVPHLPVKRAYR